MSISANRTRMKPSFLRRTLNGKNGGASGFELVPLSISRAMGSFSHTETRRQHKA